MLDAGLPLAWVTGDSVHDHSANLRRALEAWEQAYVLAAPGHEKVRWGWQQSAVSAIHAALAKADWRRRNAGSGSKGECWYEWQWVRTEGIADAVPSAPRVRSLLFRRSCTDPDDWTAYRVYAPATRSWRPWGGWPARAGASSAPSRMPSRRRGWYRYTTLTLWVLALLAVLRAITLPDAALPAKKPAGRRRPEPGRGAVPAVAAHRPCHTDWPGWIGSGAMPGRPSAATTEDRPGPTLQL